VVYNENTSAVFFKDKVQFYSFIGENHVILVPRFKSL